jgi:hypothetical protein
LFIPSSRGPENVQASIRSTHRPWCTCGTPRSRAPRSCLCQTAPQQIGTNEDTGQRASSARARLFHGDSSQLTSLKISRDARRLMLNIKAKVSNSWRETALLPSMSISSKHVREWYQRNCFARSS